MDAPPHRTLRVTKEQVVCSRLLAQLRGGEEYLDPVLRKLAAVPLPPPDPTRADRDNIESARALIKLRGGRDYVPEIIRVIADQPLPDHP